MPAFALPDPGAATWEVNGIAGPMTMTKVANDAGIAVYDGTTDIARCLAVVDSDGTWAGACADPGTAGTLATLRGITPWLIEYGSDVGQVTATAMPPTWTLASNGCSTPVANMLGAASIDPAMMGEAVCADGHAFVGLPNVLFGEGGPPDGAGMLMANGDEGWNVIDFGTGIDCPVLENGSDSCLTFGVDADLFEALLPLAPADFQPSGDLAGITDVTDVARGWVGATTDLDTIEGIVLAQATEADAPIPPVVARSGPLGGGGLTLVVTTEQPQFDDSVLTVTWALWIDTSGTGPTVVRATNWVTCARGVSDNLCI